MTDPFHLLEDCCLCPRKCHVNRLQGELGYCKSGIGYSISSICIHRGEEPPISGNTGICNVFFDHCNLQCVYCQNHQISSNAMLSLNNYSLSEVLDRICVLLDQGIPSVGFVSPVHFLPQVVSIIEGLHTRNYHPTTVWNSNAYELPEMLQHLDNYIDIFLPDFKYADPILAQKYSDAPNYPDIAIKALKTMLHLRGPRLLCDDEGTAYRGMIIRHLILPGNIDNSLNVIERIALELKPSISTSLMSQYYPSFLSEKHPEINRNLTLIEYATVKDKAEELGFTHLWTQEMESEKIYRPDFKKQDPFD